MSKNKYKVYIICEQKPKTSIEDNKHYISLLKGEKARGCFHHHEATAARTQRAVRRFHEHVRDAVVAVVGGRLHPLSRRLRPWHLLHGRHQDTSPCGGRHRGL